MTELIVMRGLPASGKSTWAKEWVSKWPINRVRVNKDDLRLMAHGKGFYDEPEISRYTEKNVHKMCFGLTDSLLSEGVSVVVDNTNLQSRTVRSYRDLAIKHKTDFEIQDLTNVDVEVCLDRDRHRHPNVGDDVIRRFYNQFIKGQPYPLPVADDPVEVHPEPYVPVQWGLNTVICDVDGTVALMGDRSPYDTTRVGEDLPNPPVIFVIENLADRGLNIVFMSARKEAAREATTEWLEKYLPKASYPYPELYLRADDDNRKDNIVKLEMFNEHIRHKYNVKYVFDDRDQVVKMWRKLGLPTFQVAEGDF